MKAIVEETPVDAIKKELTSDKLLRDTNKGGNQIYLITHHNSPSVMREIGRLREIAFRAGGGGTGKETDIDEYDTMEHPYQQLVVWDPANELILGGYRYILGSQVIRDYGDVRHALATAHMFEFSDTFIQDYLPYTIELGRSFVRTSYQSSREGSKAIFVLDNLWDGIGAVVVKNPKMKYLFGKVTMYPDFNEKARDYILLFLKNFLGDDQKLMNPMNPLRVKMTQEEFLSIFTGKTKEENYKILVKKVREQGVNVPPLVSSYISVSHSMKTFGTAINDRFGNVEETAMMITIGEIIKEKRERYIDSYISSLGESAKFILKID